jgi:hypothetical protein
MNQKFLKNSPPFSFQTKVVNALSPQIQQIRTAIIGLARLVELNQAVSAAEQRVQSPQTPPQVQQETLNIVAQPPAVSTITASSTKKQRNQSPSKVEATTVLILPAAAATESTDGGPSTSIPTKPPTSTMKTNGPTSGKSERKAEGKVRMFGVFAVRKKKGCFFGWKFFCDFLQLDF